MDDNFKDFQKAFALKKELESSSVYQIKKTLEENPTLQMLVQLESDPSYQMQKKLESDPAYQMQMKLQSDPMFQFLAKLEANDLAWFIQSADQFEIFTSQLVSVTTLLSVSLDDEAKNSLLVMLFGHIVAATEGYLSSTFIYYVTRSDDLTRRLVESDNYFAGLTLKMSEIFAKSDEIHRTVAAYLKDLIFHKVGTVKYLYEKVFELDFGDVPWFYKAVSIRHDCVHRAGFDKDENKVEISENSIIELMANCKELVSKVEARAKELREVEGS